MKRNAIRAAALCITLVVLFFSGCVRSYPGGSDKEITDFLNSCRITVSGEPAVKTVTIPNEFGDVYTKYNELQRSQGFDLSLYGGKEAQVWTFAAVSVRGEHTDSAEVHVIVCEGMIIGGDVADPALDGGMTGLK